MASMVAEHSAHSGVFQDSAGTTPAGVGDTVGYVEDLVAGAWPVIQATSGQKPTLVAGINSHPAFEGDLIDDSLGNAAFNAIASQPWSHTLVLEMDATDFQGILQSGDMFKGLFWEGSRWNYSMGGELRGSTFTADTLLILQIIVNGGSSEIWLNNTLILSGSPGTSAWTAGLQLGQMAGLFFGGKLYRARQYDGALTSTERGDEYDELSAYYASAPGGGGEEVAASFAQNASSGFPASVAVAPNTQAAALGQNVSTGYGSSARETKPAGFGQNVSEGFGSAVLPASNTEQASFGQNTSVGYGAGAQEGAPGAETVQASFGQNQPVGWGVSVLPVPNTRSASFGENTGTGFGSRVNERKAAAAGVNVSQGFASSLASTALLREAAFGQNVSVGYGTSILDGSIIRPGEMAFDIRPYYAVAAEARPYYTIEASAREVVA